jgi:hypothetical protein
MIKLFRILLDIKEDCTYLATGTQLNVNDNRKIGDISFGNNINIMIIQSKNATAKYFMGKEIKVIMFFKNKNNFKIFNVTKY